VHTVTTSCDLAAGQHHGVGLDSRGRLRLHRGANGYPAQGEFVSLPRDMGWPARPICPYWIEQWTAPLSWRKHDANPVYGPRQSGPWDSWTNGVSIVPTADGKSYRMFYAGKTGEGIGFAEAAVENPVSWREHPASPVLRPRQDNWEGGLINQPRVVVVSPSHWRMYYTGWGFEGPGSTWALGLAESFDGGVTWKRVGEQPILERGDSLSPDGGGACVPMVLRVRDEWMMWYTAGQVNPAGHQNIHLCLATSKDGMEWLKYPGNPVLSDDFTDGAERSVTSRCYVQFDHGAFRIWYSFAKPDYRIMYAESVDGIEWERSPLAPVLGPSPAPAWDDAMVEYPEIQVFDGTYRMWFCGNGYGSVGLAEGVPESGVRIALRSGDTPEPDSGWSGWAGLSREQEIEAGRFVQIRAELWSDNPVLSPALNQVGLDLVGI